MSNFWRGQRVLVAGGAGFIGSYVVEQLLEDGARVTVADSLDTGTRDNCSGIQIADHSRGRMREVAD